MKEEKLSHPQYDQQRDKDYYSLPLASFTFGRNDQKLMQMTAIKEKDDSSSIKKITFIEDSHPLTNNPIVPNDQSNSRNIKYSSTTFINKFGSHNSFLSVIIHSIYNMKHLRNFILNELSHIKEKDQHSKVLFALRSILLKYPENKRIDITQLRTSLAEIFQNRRKFLLDHPDDHIDCYFALINAIHSHYMQYPINEITDESCREKCFAHKCLWMDLARLDECECKGNSKRLFSNHNYVFDIPLDTIFDLVKSVSINVNVNMNMPMGENSHNNNRNNVKVKERHLSQIPYSMNEIQGKMFFYYKHLLNQIKSDCPMNGARCNINKNHRRLLLSNSPSYYVFALQQLHHKDKERRGNSISDILKTFMLIPKVMDSNTLFDSSPQRNNGNAMMPMLEFMGCVLMRASKIYSCVFKYINGKGGNGGWVYYEDETIITLPSWFELIAFCIKNGDMPIMLFYQCNDKDKSIQNYNYDITAEDAVALERYAANADNLSKYYMNRIRILEEVISIQDVNSSSNMKGSQVSSTNDSNEIGSVKGGEINPFIRGNVGNTTNVANTNTNVGYNNNKQRVPNVNLINGTVIDYYCQNCHSKNKFDNKVCGNCGLMNNINNNEGFNNEINRNSQGIPQSQSQAQGSSHKQKVKSPNQSIQRRYPKDNNNPLLSSNDKNPSINTSNPFKSEKGRSAIDQDTDMRARKYYDMPKPYVPKKEGPIMIKNNNITCSPSNNQPIISEPNPTSSLIKAEDKRSRQSSSSKKQTNKSNTALNQPEVWVCSTCNTLNKDYEYQCKYCKSIKKSENSYTRIHTPKAQQSGHLLSKATGTHSSKKLEKKQSQQHIEQQQSHKKNIEKKYQNFNTISSHNDINEKGNNSLRSPPKKNNNQNGICYPNTKGERPRTSLLDYPTQKK